MTQGNLPMCDNDQGTTFHHTADGGLVDVRVTSNRRIRQLEFYDWCVDNFGESAANTLERVYRVLEEAIELGQSEDVPFEEVMRIAAHVYSKPKGRPDQEVAGTALGLMAYCEHKGLLVDTCEQMELERVYRITAQDPNFFKDRQKDKVTPLNRPAPPTDGPTGPKGQCCYGALGPVGQCAPEGALGEPGLHGKLRGETPYMVHLDAAAWLPIDNPDLPGPGPDEPGPVGDPGVDGEDTNGQD